MIVRQRGVALITAVLIVALATILAVNVATKGYMDQRRSMTMFGVDQAFEVALGGEAFAADGLMQSVAQQTTDLSQLWATPLPALPVDERGTLEGSLEDMQGRFNLNLLSDPDPQIRNRYIKQFQRLLEQLNIEQEWAPKIADWIDTDSVPQQDGAEENVYSGQTPPYHTGNMTITRTSEILALVDPSLGSFGRDRYLKLKNFITALPPSQKINVCTAPAEVLDSFSYEGKQKIFSSTADFLPQQRKSTGGCFPTKNGYTTRYLPGTEESQHFNEATIQTSNFFQATILVTIGTTEFTLYSLLYRNQTGVRVVTRSFGTT